MVETKRPSEIGTVIDAESVQEFFDKLEDAFVNSTETFKRLMSKVADDYKKKQLLIEEEIAKKVHELEQTGIKNNAELEKHYKMALIRENAKLAKERELELQNSIYKKQVELNTKAGKEKYKQELINQKELNQAWIKQYEELEKQGMITEQQREDLAVKRQEVADAKRFEYEKKRDESLNKLIAEGLNVINNGINTYANLQTGFNARIQGTNSVSIAERMRFGLNTFGALEERLSTAVGVQPYIKTETMLTNLSELVSQGIVANVEQRAFLASVKDNIATTFDVANSSLLRIVRLQQSDSTAARLGMEAYLTRFLNDMVENTEYLNQTFDSVSDALIEASSQMSMKASTEFEFIVQKWLGALSGTGLSETTSQNLAQAIGYLGSGNISALSGSNMQNLLVMAASRAGLDYSSLLTQGLNASTTNQLMRAVADYMVEIGSNTNNVVRSQLAQTFGLSISDLTAAKQLSGDFGKISNTSMSLLGMYGELAGQMSMMPGRMSTAQMIQNVFDNSLFGLATNIAQNPVLAALWKVTDMIQSTTGGIDLMSVMPLSMGTGLLSNAKIENLMKMGIVGVGSLGMIGDVISGIGSSLNPASMMAKLGITPLTTGIRRGSGLGSLMSGLTTSASALVGNTAGTDIQESIVAAETSEAKAQIDEEEQKQDADEKSTKNQVLRISTYLVETFDTKLDTLLSRVDTIETKMINGA